MAFDCDEGERWTAWNGQRLSIPFYSSPDETKQIFRHGASLNVVFTHF